MILEEEVTISASKIQILAAIKNPRILEACIPGCESLIVISETDYEATVLLKIGPIKARFQGGVTLNFEGEPDRFSLQGNGKGGRAGQVKGSANITLDDRGDFTVFKYVAKADINGKLAQLGSRLIDRAAKKLADRFFTSFVAEVEKHAAG